jgi:phosphoribosylanthranilate isomerase
MKVKICGITNLKDALLCQSFGADALGFIFYKKSKRYVLPEVVSEITEELSPFIMKVGVFVNESTEVINKLALELKLNCIQLHGDEFPEDIEKINLPVIKSFRISEDFEFSILGKYKNASYLLDSYSNSLYGGSGNKFNWDLIPKEIQNKVILAGGISHENIADVFKNINPAAVDLSSSLETEPGLKDEKKVKIFFEKFNALRYGLC